MVPTFLQPDCHFSDAKALPLGTERNWNVVSSTVITSSTGQCARFKLCYSLRSLRVKSCTTENLRWMCEQDQCDFIQYSTTSPNSSDNPMNPRIGTRSKQEQSPPYVVRFVVESQAYPFPASMFTICSALLRAPPLAGLGTKGPSCFGPVPIPKPQYPYKIE